MAQQGACSRRKRAARLKRNVRLQEYEDTDNPNSALRDVNGSELLSHITAPVIGSQGCLWRARRLSRFG